MSFIDFIYSIDLSVLNFIQNTFRCDFLDVLMKFFSYIGEAGVIWLAVAVAFLFFKKTRITGILVLCALLLGFISGELILKNIIQRPRPFVDYPDIIPLISPPGSFSCPSGHSCSSFAAATVISSRHKEFAVPACLVAFMIAFSRIYNCVHYPSDVFCGITLGILSAVLVLLIYKFIISKRREVNKNA